MGRRLHVFCDETRLIIPLLAERGNHCDRAGWKATNVTYFKWPQGRCSTWKPSHHEQAEYVISLSMKACEGARLRLVSTEKTYQGSDRMAKPLVLDME